MKIGDFDTDKSVFIVAELSANHSGSLEIAKRTIQAAKKSGADAIKLQTYTPDSLTLNSTNDDFIIKGGLWNGRNLYDLYKEAMTPRSWHKELFDTARDEGLICFSSPFCVDDAQFLEQFNPPAYKIASFEVADAEFIAQIAAKNKPIIISTGIATTSEIEDALQACKSVGNENIILLKCTSSYPAPLSDLNLNAINTLKSYGVEVGLSDHSFGFLAPVIATSLGAKMIEKHFILDKSVRSADSAFSLDSDEFTQMVKMVRDASLALGDCELKESNPANRRFARSLYLVKDIKKGEILTDNHIRSVRPSFGLHPKLKNNILGKRANADIKANTALSLDMFI